MLKKILSFLEFNKSRKALEKYFLSGYFPNGTPDKKLIKGFYGYVEQLKEVGIDYFDIIEINNLYFIKEDYEVSEDIKSNLQKGIVKEVENEPFFDINQSYIKITEICLRNNGCYAVAQISPADYSYPKFVWKIKLDKKLTVDKTKWVFTI